MPFGGLTYDWKGPKLEASEAEKRSIAEYLVETALEPSNLMILGRTYQNPLCVGT